MGGNMKTFMVGACLLVAVVARASPAIDGGTLLGWMKSRDERDGVLAVVYIGGVREVAYQKEHCGEPGARTIWLGMQKIAVFVEGARYARQFNDG